MTVSAVSSDICSCSSVFVESKACVVFEVSGTRPDKPALSRRPCRCEPGSRGPTRPGRRRDAGRERTGRTPEMTPASCRRTSPCRACRRSSPRPRPVIASPSMTPPVTTSGGFLILSIASRTILAAADGALLGARTTPHLPWKASLRSSLSDWNARCARRFLTTLVVDPGLPELGCGCRRLLDGQLVERQHEARAHCLEVLLELVEQDLR